MVEPHRIVDARIRNALTTFCSDLKEQAARALQLRGIATSQMLCEVPAKTAHEMTSWMTGHVALVEAMPVIGVDLNTLAKTVLVLKCRLRLGTDLVDEPNNPHQRPLPALPVTTRARRELRPRTPLIGASRPGKLALSRRSTDILQHNRDRSKMLRSEQIPSVRHVVKKTRACRASSSSNVSKRSVSSGVIPQLGMTPSQTMLEQTPDVKTSLQMVKDKPQYVRRALYLAQRSGAAPSACPLDERDKPDMRTIFSPPLTKLVCPWQTALLFRDSPGFFRWAEHCKVSTDTLAAMFHIAIGKRCGAENSRVKVAGFVSTYVMFAAQRQALFYGEGALFSLIEFLTLLKRRGVSVPGMAKWALRVFDEILSLNLPLDHPAIVVLTTRDRSGVPKQVKQAPMLELQLILDLEKLTVDRERPFGMRFYASAYLLMVFASLRFSDVKAIFDIWRSGTAICGRSIDRKLRSRPIITWATPSQGFITNGKWTDPLFSMWEKYPPLKGGHHALYRFSDDSWEIDPTRRPPYFAVLKMFKKLCEFLGYKNPKWTLRSARNWFPTCASQLGWSEDDRRKLGHWAPGSYMMEKYDRAICTTELRLRSSIFGMITDKKWEPTPAFEVPLTLTDSHEGVLVNPPVKEKDDESHEDTQGKRTETVEESDSSTSSITWDNKSDGLSEVDITDLYSDAV